MYSMIVTLYGLPYFTGRPWGHRDRQTLQTIWYKKDTQRAECEKSAIWRCGLSAFCENIKETLSPPCGHVLTDPTHAFRSHSACMFPCFSAGIADRTQLQEERRSFAALADAGSCVSRTAWERCCPWRRDGRVGLVRRWSFGEGVITSVLPPGFGVGCLGALLSILEPRLLRVRLVRLLLLSEGGQPDAPLARA